MRKLESYRLREGITKRELARRLKTSEDAIHYWLSGRTIGRKATVERMEEFLQPSIQKRPLRHCWRFDPLMNSKLSANNENGGATGTNKIY
jgi:transcriptional regulator with XRE-family HTH domain